MNQDTIQELKELLPETNYVPIVKDGFMYVTDGQIALKIPTTNEDSDKLLSYHHTLIKLFESDKSLSLPFKVKDVQENLEKNLERETETRECDECDGEGSVEATYTDREGDCHDFDVACPICNGNGILELDTKTERIKSTLKCKIYKSAYSCNCAEIITNIAILLNQDTIYIRNESVLKEDEFLSLAPTFLSIGEVDCIVMPVIAQPYNTFAFEVLVGEE